MNSSMSVKFEENNLSKVYKKTKIIKKINQNFHSAQNVRKILLISARVIIKFGNVKHQNFAHYAIEGFNKKIWMWR